MIALHVLFACALCGLTQTSPVGALVIPGIAAPAPTPSPTTGHTTGRAGDQESFAALTAPFARQASQALGWPTSLILAQWGVEHGWKLPDFDGFNLGNSKLRDDCAAGPTSRDFCYSDDLEEGTRLYIAVARNGLYEAVAPASRVGGPEAAARALGESPWDEGHYSAGCGTPGCQLVAALRDYDLTRYDRAA